MLLNVLVEKYKELRSTYESGLITFHINPSFTTFISASVCISPLMFRSIIIIGSGAVWISYLSVVLCFIGKFATGIGLRTCHCLSQVLPPLHSFYFSSALSTTSLRNEMSTRKEKHERNSDKYIVLCLLQMSR